MSGVVKLLKNRSYRIYFTGQLISISGTWMQIMAQSWLVYRLSHSAYWLGVVSFSSQVPAFFLSPIAGYVADRLERRKILMVVQIVCGVQAAALAVLVHLEIVEMWHIVVLSVSLGVVNAFELTTRHAFVVDLVGKENLQSAISLNSALINCSRVFGPSLAGIVLAVTGEAACFALNAVSFIPVCIGLACLTTVPRQTSVHQKFRTEISDGFKYVFNHRGIFVVTLFGMLAFFMSSPVMVLMPVFAKSVLHGGAGTLSILMAAVGAGAVFGALNSERSQKHPARYWRHIGMFVSFWGLAMMVVGLSKVLWLSVVAGTMTGFFMMTIFPSLNSRIQHLVVDSMRGRVMSIYTMTFLGAVPLGSLTAGWVSDRLGAPFVIATTGVVTMVIGAILSSGVLKKVMDGAILARSRHETLESAVDNGPTP